MNDRFDDFDPKLEQLFRREHSHLPAEPFASVTLRIVAAERKRTALRRRLVQVAAAIALVALSPQLIAASVSLSAWLDRLFAFVSTWIASPLGLLVGALCGLTALALKWARVW